MNLLRYSVLACLVLVLACPAWALEEFRSFTLQNAAGATGNGTAVDTASYASLALQVTISATATVTFEGTQDGSTWASAVCTSTANTSGTLVTSATATGLYQCSVAGLAQFRARISSFGSGTVTVTGRVTTAVIGKKGGSGGAGGAPTDATYITQTADGTLSAEQALSSLSTGCVSVTTTTGVLASRTITGTANQITVTNGDCSAAPTISIPTSPTLPGTTSGTFSGNLTGNVTGTASIAATGDSATSFFSSGTIEDARLPSSMADKVFTGSILLPNGTAVPGTCTIGMIYFDNNAGAGVNLYGCTATNTWILLGDGGGGSGTVTVVGAGALTSTALVTGGGTTTLQTPSATATMDSSGNISTPGSISTGVGGSAAGALELGQGTAPSAGTTSVKLYAPASVTSYIMKLPAASATGFLLGTDATNVNTMSFVGFSGTGNVARVSSPSFTTPDIGAATATTPSANDNDTSVATTAYVQTELTAYASDTVTNTNKTTDCEGTGNVCTIPRRIWLPAAGCNNATAGSIWDLPSASPAVAACITGTNTQKGVLDFADSASLSAQITYKLPSTWTGTVDANVKWLTTATTGDVVWQLATICVADAETDDPAFNTASTVTDTAKGTTNQTNDAAITTVTVTGCAASELMHVKILRDSAHASDTLAATARLIGVELVIREAI